MKGGDQNEEMSDARRFRFRVRGPSRGLQKKSQLALAPNPCALVRPKGAGYRWKEGILLLHLGKVWSKHNVKSDLRAVGARRKKARLSLRKLDSRRIKGFRRRYGSGGEGRFNSKKKQEPDGQLTQGSGGGRWGRGGLK